MTEFTCAHHTAEVYVRGGVTFVGDLTPLAAVTWTRLRDEISTAQVTMPPTECCDLLGDLRSGYHELHIFRDGQPVWEGVIARVEYERDTVTVFAEDMLWVAKRTVLQAGYSHAYPNIGYAMDRVDWLIRNQCFALNNDPWRMVPHLHMLSPFGAGPKTSRSVAAYEMYVYQDFDKYAEDHGVDYTVVNRDIYYWDHGLDWLRLPALHEEFLSESPRVVEYGNELYTRAFVSNARGYAGVSTAPSPWPETYGFVDMLITNLDDTGDLTDKLAAAQDEVTKVEEELAHHQEQLAQALLGEDSYRRNAEYLRARADLTTARAEQAAAVADNSQFLAGEWQRWADELQRQASDTNTNKEAQEFMRQQRDRYETARSGAEEKRELADRQQAVAETARVLANVSGTPADDAVADDEENKAVTYNNEANTAADLANQAKIDADNALAAARVGNDPTKQGEADTVQGLADNAAIVARDNKALAINMDDIARTHEKEARDMESGYERAKATTQSWQANITEAQQELDWAINGRHGVPGKTDQQGLNDVIAEIQAAIVVWSDTARRNLIGHYPAPLGIVVPANTTLLPGSGWQIEHMVPGGTFPMTVERMCRQVSAIMMINEVRVEESAPDGERVQLTAATVGIETP